MSVRRCSYPLYGYHSVPSSFRVVENVITKSVCDGCVIHDHLCHAFCEFRPPKICIYVSHQVFSSLTVTCW